MFSTKQGLAHLSLLPVFNALLIIITIIIIIQIVLQFRDVSWMEGNDIKSLPSTPTRPPVLPTRLPSPTTLLPFRRHLLTYSPLPPPPNPALPSLPPSRATTLAFPNSCVLTDGAWLTKNFWEGQWEWVSEWTWIGMKCLIVKLWCGIALVFSD